MGLEHLDDGIFCLLCLTVTVLYHIWICLDKQPDSLSLKHLQPSLETKGPVLDHKVSPL